MKYLLGNLKFKTNSFKNQNFQMDLIFKNVYPIYINLVRTIIKRNVHQVMSGKRFVSPKPDNESKRIVWVDLEMTGLDIERDHILEIACLVSDEDLNVVATGPNIVIHQPDEILNSMDEWCIATHGESGLTKSSRESKISVKDAEEKVLRFLKSYVPEKTCPLGGNSVYMDRLFMRKYMPTLNEYLHYRIVDVSSIKEIVKRWYPKEYSNIPQKKFSHRGMNDILESLEELKYYKANVFKQ